MRLTGSIVVNSLGLAFALLVSSAACTFAQKQEAAPAGHSAAIIDPQALELLKLNRDAMLRLKTYSAVCKTTLTRVQPMPQLRASEHWYAQLAAARPNRMRYETWDLPLAIGGREWQVPATAPTFSSVNNGKEWVKEHGKTYSTSDDVAPASLHTLWEPWIGFWSAERSVYGQVMSDKSAGRLVSLTFAPSNDDHLRSSIVEKCSQTNNGIASEWQATWYFGKDHLIYKSTAKFINNVHQTVYDCKLSGVVTNGTLSDKQFSYTTRDGVMPSMAVINDPNLLKIGAAAPEFAGTDAANKPVRLADYKGNVVVVDFWGAWCHNCVEAMPENEALVKRMRNRGLKLVLLAVDDTDTRAEFDAWVKKNRKRYPDIIFVHTALERSVSLKKYRVQAYPTQYVLKANRDIQATFVGWDKGAEELEKAVLAAGL